MTQFERTIRATEKHLIEKALDKGIYENFGQTEYRKLKEKLDKKYQNPYMSPAKEEYAKLDAFNEWAMTFVQRKRK